MLCHTIHLLCVEWSQYLQHCLQQYNSNSLGDATSKLLGHIISGKVCQILHQVHSSRFSSNHSGSPDSNSWHGYMFPLERPSDAGALLQHWVRGKRMVGSMDLLQDNVLAEGSGYGGRIGLWLVCQDGTTL